MEQSITVRVFDLGTEKGREEFFAANPWLVDDKKYSHFIVTTKQSEK